MSPDTIDAAPTAPAPRLMFSVEEAAELLSISRTRVFVLLKNGALASVRVGRLRRIPAPALTAYVDQLIRDQPARAADGDRG